MDRYKEYHIEDFVLDANFQRWVRYDRDEDTLFWEKLTNTLPAKKADIATARTLLHGIYKSEKEIISEEEIEIEISGLILKIQSERQELAASVEIAQGASRRLIWWLSAASITLACLLGFWFVSRKQVNSYGKQDLMAGKLTEKVNNGQTDQMLEMRDGTTILLKPGSVVRYSDEYDQKRREITLSGEAVFKVAKNAEKPFLVYADNMVVKVLGTTFRVKHLKYATEALVEVTEGKVSVYNKQNFISTDENFNTPSKGVVLTANQKVIFGQAEGTMTKLLVDSPRLIARSEGLPAFVYRNTPIADVLTDIEKAYQVDIIFDAEQLTDCPITASLSGQSLLEKVAIICETVEAKFEVIDGHIVIYGKNCLN